jgi:glyoxylase I family protein
MSDGAAAKAVHTGFHHLTLNVQDVGRAENWYTEVLGFQRVAGFSTDAFTRVILQHPESGAVLGLNRHIADVASEPFDERRAGLDHLAFRVEGSDSLRAWLARFDALGIPHSEIKAGAVPGSSLMTFRDPDGLQLEVFASVP